MSKTVDLGPVSAYALAVKYGYTGTEEEWVNEMEAKRKEAVEAAESASDSETASANSASASASSASTASNKADAAANSATRAESYAVGGTGIRQNEDVDNAKYYYQQVKQISGGLSGALIPLGTVAFADLQGQTKQVGYMYNISDDFTTDDTFKDGSGYKYPAGTNVYYTADGYWDCLAGTITPEGIGALAVDGDSADNTVTFTSYDTEEPNAWVDVAKMQSGEKHISLFGKITAMFKNIRWLYKMLGTTDISTIGGGTVTGAISSQNDALATLNTNLSSNHQWKEYTNLTTLGLDNNCTMDDILTALYNKGANSMLCMAIWKDSAPNLVLASTSNKHILTIKVVGSGYVYVSDFDVNTGIEYVRGHYGYNYTAWSSTKSIS